MKMIQKIAISFLGLSAFAAASFAGLDEARAEGSDSANLSVSSSVSGNCTISTSSLGFGAYDPVEANLSSPLDGTGGVIVRCTNGLDGLITLDEGANETAESTGDAPERRMSDGAGHFLEYDLFSDSGRTAIWGNTTETAVEYQGTGNSTGITVYGRMPAGQQVPIGSYSDTVVATVSF